MVLTAAVMIPVHVLSSYVPGKSIIYECLWILQLLRVWYRLAIFPVHCTFHIIPFQIDMYLLPRPRSRGHTHMVCRIQHIHRHRQDLIYIDHVQSDTWLIHPHSRQPRCDMCSYHQPFSQLTFQIYRADSSSNHYTLQRSSLV